MAQAISKSISEFPRLAGPGPAGSRFEHWGTLRGHKEGLRAAGVVLTAWWLWLLLHHHSSSYHHFCCMTKDLFSSQVAFYYPIISVWVKIVSHILFVNVKILLHWI